MARDIRQWQNRARINPIKKSASLESSETRRSQILRHHYISGEFNFEFLPQRKGNLAHRVKTGILTMLNPRNR